MKATIGFSIDFFGEPIHMSFEKEALKERYEEYIYYCKIRNYQQPTIREFIKIKITEGITKLIINKYL